MRPRQHHRSKTSASKSLSGWYLGDAHLPCFSMVDGLYLRSGHRQVSNLKECHSMMEWIRRDRRARRIEGERVRDGTATMGGAIPTPTHAGRLQSGRWLLSIHLSVSRSPGSFNCHRHHSHADQSGAGGPERVRCPIDASSAGASPARRAVRVACERRLAKKRLLLQRTNTMNQDGKARSVALAVLHSALHHPLGLSLLHGVSLQCRANRTTP